jgi:hypothetical protein
MSIERNHQAEYTHWRPEHVQIIDGRAVRFRDVCVHEFVVGDVEDPDIIAGEPIWNWQQSESGTWVMEHAYEKPYWVRQHDYNTWGHKYRIMARLSEQNEIFWQLKWGKK